MKIRIARTGLSAERSEIELADADLESVHGGQDPLVYVPVGPINIPVHVKTDDISAVELVGLTDILG